MRSRSVNRSAAPLSWQWMSSPSFCLPLCLLLHSLPFARLYFVTLYPLFRHALVVVSPPFLTLYPFSYLSTSSSFAVFLFKWNALLYCKLLSCFRKPRKPIMHRKLLTVHLLTLKKEATLSRFRRCDHQKRIEIEIMLVTQDVIWRCCYFILQLTIKWFPNVAKQVIWTRL